jgi:hypothetical protein
MRGGPGSAMPPDHHILPGGRARRLASGGLVALPTVEPLSSARFKRDHDMGEASNALMKLRP